MKENKRNLYVFLALTTITFMLLIMSQYSFTSIAKITIGIFPFLSGYKGFWENIVLGLFASSLLMMISSAINYITCRNRLEQHIKNIYCSLEIEIHRFEFNKSTKKDIFIEKCNELWNELCEYDVEDKPIFIRRKRHTTNKLLLEMLEEIILITSFVWENGNDDGVEVFDKVESIQKKYSDDLRTGFNIKIIDTPKAQEPSTCVFFLSPEFMTIWKKWNNKEKKMNISLSQRVITIICVIFAMVLLPVAYILSRIYPMMEYRECLLCSIAFTVVIILVIDYCQHKKAKNFQKKLEKAGPENLETVKKEAETEEAKAKAWQEGIDTYKLILLGTSALFSFCASISILPFYESAKSLRGDVVLILALFSFEEAFKKYFLK